MGSSQGGQKAGHRNGGAAAQHLVPLAAFLKREFNADKIVCPTISYGQACQSKKGEDLTIVKTDCQRVPGDGSSTFAVFGVLDGHNGSSAALYAKENLMNDVLSALPATSSREEWLAALPRALVAGFVKTDKDFQKKGETSGTTVTFVVIDKWTITVASVGDSRCILDPRGGAVSALTVDHRLEENKEERERVIGCGGEVGRLSIAGGVEIGPLRCWPGGLCLSRSIGDLDVGEFIVPIPHVKQIKAGGRLIIASDGVWDALSNDKAAKCCRGLPAELAARQVVKEALRARGLCDDTTCLVVDLWPPDNYIHTIPSPVNKQNKWRSILFGWRSNESTAVVANKPADTVVEEIFEEGSARLADRLVVAIGDLVEEGRGLSNVCDGSNAGCRLGSDPCLGIPSCAVCQINMTLKDGISVHAGSIFSVTNKALEGPFVCVNCKAKNDAMEGKQQPRV